MRCRILARLRLMRRRFPHFDFRGWSLKTKLVLFIGLFLAGLIGIMILVVSRQDEKDFRANLLERARFFGYTVARRMPSHLEREGGRELRSRLMEDLKNFDEIMYIIVLYPEGGVFFSSVSPQRGRGQERDVVVPRGGAPLLREEMQLQASGSSAVLTVQEGRLERELALGGVRRGAAGDPVFDCWWILKRHGSYQGSIRIGFSRIPLIEHVAFAKKRLVGAGFTLLVALLLLLVLLVHYHMRPLALLTGEMARLGPAGSGTLETKLERIRPEDIATNSREVRALQTSFIAMKKLLLSSLRRMRSANSELDAARASLEEQVAARTEELEAKNSALEYEIRERKRAEEQLRHAANHDALTGLCNRRSFMERLRENIAAAKRHGFPLSLCLGDLGYFKSVNDTYGHWVGDEVLARFGRLLREHIRSEDVPARYGGEEFCILMPYTDRAGALETCRRLQRFLTHETFESSDGATFHVTTSWGVVALRETEALEDLVVRADQALYRAKQKGRNRVEL